MSVLPMGSILPSIVARRGAKTPAVIFGSEVLSWGDLERRSTRRAWALKALGVKQNDLVTIALPNCAEFYETTFALWKLGATPHIVSWRLPVRELAAILEVARPRLLTATDPNLIEAFGGYDPERLLGSREDPLPPETSTYWKAMSSGGSTGRPKIIVDHAPSTVNLDAPNLTGMPTDKCVLNPGPLYHNAPFTQTHTALFRGNTVIGLTKFDPEETLRLIDRHRVAWTSMVPTMMLRIWRLPEEVRGRYDLSSLERIWHMAAPMPQWLKEAWIEWLGPERIWELYGGTEMQGFSFITGTEWLSHKGSVGRPFMTDIKIIGESGQVCPIGVTGEIYMRPHSGPGSTYHYIGAEARGTDDGFESIGDFGWMDSDGYLYLADRRTDMILSGGANIYPAEVEAALMEHPGVEVAVVIGLPHEDLGQVVHAIVKPHPNHDLDWDALAAFVGDRLARYKTPRSYELTDKALRDDAGKVRRSQLRAERIEAGLSGCS